MTRTFRTATGRKVRVNMSEEEIWRARFFRMLQCMTAAGWIFAFAKAARLI